MSRLSPGRWAASIALAYLALALAYGFANPPFEATDEIRHFGYVRYLALNRALPPVSAEASKELQAHHPPLYHALAAFITAPAQSKADADYAPPINPFWGFRYYEPSSDNKNQYLHSPDARWPSSSGAALIVYLARWLSTLFGLGVVVTAYRLGRLLFPERPALALSAMALVAFNPTLLHSASSVNNDAAAAFFGSWAVAEAAAIAQSGSARGRAIRLGAALGLGVMSKVSVAVLGIAGGAALAFVVFRAAREQGDWRLEIRHCGLGLLVAALIAGWWFARNYALTGDPMGLSDYQSAWVGQADRARLLREAVSALPYAWTTAWARFDYGQIVLPGWVYGGMGVVCGLGLVGLAREWRQLKSPGVLITVLGAAVSLAGWGALMITIPATAHARHILQAYPALGLLLAAGWHGLVPRGSDGMKARRDNVMSLSLGVFTLLLSLYALLGYLAPAFAYPRAVTALPADATPASANFEEAAEIVGYRLSTDSVEPGGRVDVTVFWKPLSQTAAPLQVFVHLVDTQGIIAAQRDTYPGLGSAATTTWRAGKTFADTYRIFIPDTAYAPESLVVRVGLWNTAESRPLIADGSDALTLGGVALRTPEGKTPNPVKVNFENRLTLAGYSLDRRVIAPGDTVALTTYWAAADIDSDYWAYAHVVGGDGRIWAIADSIIIPPTTQWSLDALTSEARLIALAPDTPPGQYTLEFGVTRIRDSGQQRLSVLADDGHEIGDHIELAKLRVAP